MVEEELSTRVSLFWEGVGEQIERGAAESVEEADLSSTEMETGERTCRKRSCAKLATCAFNGTSGTLRWT